MTEEDYCEKHMTMSQDDQINRLLPVNPMENPVYHQYSQKSPTNQSTYFLNKQDLSFHSRLSVQRQTNPQKSKENRLPNISKSLPKHNQSSFTESNIFDKIDDLITKQGQYLNRNKINYEKTLIKLFKLDCLQSKKAKQMINQLNKSQSQQQKKKKNSKSKKLKTPTQKPHTYAMYGI